MFLHQKHAILPIYIMCHCFVIYIKKNRAQSPWVGSNLGTYPQITLFHGPYRKVPMWQVTYHIWYGQACVEPEVSKSSRQIAPKRLKVTYGTFCQHLFHKINEDLNKNSTHTYQKPAERFPLDASIISNCFEHTIYAVVAITYTMQCDKIGNVITNCFYGHEKGGGGSRYPLQVGTTQVERAYVPSGAASHVNSISNPFRFEGNCCNRGARGSSWSFFGRWDNDSYVKSLFARTGSSQWPI